MEKEREVFSISFFILKCTKSNLFQWKLKKNIRNGVKISKINTGSEKTKWKYTWNFKKFLLKRNLTTLSKQI